MSAARRPLRAVVTAGGTEEALDDVRTLSNVSSGRFGSAIARALDRRGVETTVLASRALAARAAEELRGRVHSVPYRSFADLDRALAALEEDPPDVLFMAAAVSDFGPARAAGKLSSDTPSLDVHLVRNPKLLARLRDSLGPRVVLVGFKLLTGAAPGELERIARSQARAARLDLTVANDLVELHGDLHPVLLVPPEGVARRLEGHREDVADRIVDAVLALVDARPHPAHAHPAHAHPAHAHPAERPDASTIPGAEPGVGQPLATAVGRLADRLGWSAASRALRVRGGADAMLLDATEGVDALLAVDDVVGQLDAQLVDGATPSDAAACAALAEAARAGRWNGGPFALGVEGGGALLGLDARSVDALAAGFSEALDALEGACAGTSLVREGARPFLDGARVAGATVPTRSGALVPFILPRCRARGLGDVLARGLAARGARIAVAPENAAFFFARGFLRAAAAGGPVSGGAPSALLELEPPDRTMAIAAASVALVDPLRRRVLLGLRKVAPYAGHWALPGGRCAPHEDARATASRELAEETGIMLPAELTPRLVTRVLTGDGDRLFAIDGLVFLVLHAAPPTPSEEMDASWISLGAARAVRPMTAGTRLVLRRIESLLAGHA